MGLEFAHPTRTPQWMEFLSENPTSHAKNVNVTIAVTCAVIGACVNALGYVAQKHDYATNDSGMWCVEKTIVNDCAKHSLICCPQLLPPNDSLNCCPQLPPSSSILLLI